MHTSKSLLSVAAATIIGLSLAACSSEPDTSSSTSGNSETSSESAPAPEAMAQISMLTGESTAVALDQGFVDALTTLGLTPGVVGGATLADGSISFPITGGNLTYFEPGSVYPYVVGGIQHEGSGLSLTAGDTTVELNNFYVDPGTSMLYGDVLVNGSEAVANAYLFFLDGSTLNPLESSGNQAILEGTTVEMSADAAALLNQTFNTDAVMEGLVVGIATITVNTM